MQNAGSKKLNLSFSNVSPNTTNATALNSVVSAAAGANTSFYMDACQVWLSADLVSLLTTASSKKITLDFNGAQSSEALLNSVITAAGGNTTISMNTVNAQPWTEAALLALINCGK